MCQRESTQPLTATHINTYYPCARESQPSHSLQHTSTLIILVPERVNPATHCNTHQLLLSLCQRESTQPLTATHINSYYPCARESQPSHSLQHTSTHSILVPEKVNPATHCNTHQLLLSLCQRESTQPLTATTSTLIILVPERVNPATHCNTHQLLLSLCQRESTQPLTATHINSYYPCARESQPSHSLQHTSTLIILVPERVNPATHCNTHQLLLSLCQRESTQPLTATHINSYYPCARESQPSHSLQTHQLLLSLCQRKSTQPLTATHINSYYPCARESQPSHSLQHTSPLIILVPERVNPATHCNTHQLIVSLCQRESTQPLTATHINSYYPCARESQPSHSLQHTSTLIIHVPERVNPATHCNTHQLILSMCQRESTQPLTATHINSYYPCARESQPSHSLQPHQLLLSLCQRESTQPLTATHINSYYPCARESQPSHSLQHTSTLIILVPERVNPATHCNTHQLLLSLCQRESTQPLTATHINSYYLWARESQPSHSLQHTSTLIILVPERVNPATHCNTHQLLLSLCQRESTQPLTATHINPYYPCARESQPSHSLQHTSTLIILVYVTREGERN